MEVIKTDTGQKMTGKRILFVTYDSIKAPILHAQGIPHLKAYSKLGYQCGIVTVEDKISAEEFQMYSRQLISAGLRWHYIRHRRSLLPPASLTDMIVMFFFICGLIFRYHYQIIHCRSYIAEAAGLLSSLLWRRKNIFDMRGLYPDEYVLSGYIRRGAIYKLYKCLEFWEIKTADKVVVVSHRFASYIRRLYFKGQPEKFRKKVMVIPNCTDTGKFNIPSEQTSVLKKRLKLQKRFIFVYSGSLAQWHLWQKAIDYFSVIRKKDPRAFFLFLTYESADTVRQYFKNKKIADKDFKVIRLASADVPLYLSAADIGLFFIYPDISKQVSSAIKFAEFLAAGLPVISNYGIGDIPEIISRNRLGILYTLSGLEDTNELYSRFKQFLKQENLSVLRKRCRSVARKELDISIALKKYISIYRELLKK